MQISDWSGGITTVKRAQQTMCWEGRHFSSQRCWWDELEINVYSNSRILL